MNCLSYSNLVDCYTGTGCKILVAGSFDHKVVDNTDDRFDAKSARKANFQQELKYLSEYPNYQGEIMKNASECTIVLLNFVVCYDSNVSLHFKDYVAYPTVDNVLGPTCCTTRSSARSYFYRQKSYTRNCMHFIKNVIRRTAWNYSSLEKSYLKKVTFCKSLKYVFVCAMTVVFIRLEGKQDK